MMSGNATFDFRQRVLRIASVTSLPFQSITELPSGKYIGDGFSFKILDEMARFFNFSYEIVVPPDGEYGKLVNDTQWTGLIGLLVNGSVDMAAATISKTIERRSVVKFTSNLYKDTIGILLERPNGSDNSGALLAPFETKVWIWVVAMSVFMGPLLYLFIVTHRCCVFRKEKSIKKRKKARFRAFLRKEEAGRLGDCIWFIYSSLLKQSSSLTSSYISVRILIAFWWMTSMLITAFYSANLTAFLSLNNISLGHTLEAILSSGIKWMYLEGTALDDALHKPDLYIDSDRNQLSLLRKSMLRGKGIRVDSNDEVYKLIYEGYAYLEEASLLNFLLLTDFRESGGQCRFTLRKLPFFEHSVGFAFPLDSPYAEVFTRHIETLHQSGLIVKWINEYMPEMDLCALERDHQLSQSEQPLTLEEVHSAFYLLVFGIGAGFIILTMENIWKKNMCKEKFSNRQRMTVSSHERIHSIYNRTYYS